MFCGSMRIFCGAFGSNPLDKSLQARECFLWLRMAAHQAGVMKQVWRAMGAGTVTQSVVAYCSSGNRKLCEPTDFILKIYICCGLKAALRFLHSLLLIYINVFLPSKLPRFVLSATMTSCFLFMESSYHAN